MGKNFEDQHHTENDIKDVIVTQGPLPDFRDRYEKTIYRQGEKAEVEVFENKRNITAETDFQERMEKWLLLPHSKREMLEECFTTYACSFVLYNIGSYIYEGYPTVGAAILIAYIICLSFILLTIIRKPTMSIIGVWRVFFIALGLL